MRNNERTYTNIREVYRERGQQVRYWEYFGLLIGTAWVIIAVAIGGLEDQKTQLYLALAGALILISLVRLISMHYGLGNFDKIWSDLSLDLTPASEELYREVEAELGEESTRFTHVIFTKSYLIVFKDIGSFARVIDVSEVRLEETKSYVGPATMFNKQSLYRFTCEVAPLGDVLLSNEEDELTHILYEIRLRHPAVKLNDEAQSYFFPTSVSVE